MVGRVGCSRLVATTRPIFAVVQFDEAAQRKDGDDVDQRLDEPPVEQAVGQVDDFLEGVVGDARLTVGPRLCHGLVRVHQSDDAGKLVDVVTLQSIRVAAAVPPLVDLHDDLADPFEGFADGAHDTLRVLRMLLQELQLVRRQTS